MIPEQMPSVPQRLRMLRPLRRRQTDLQSRRARRGVYLLPSAFTMANMFCGYACIVHAMRGEMSTAALFIGFAFVLDMLDGRIARMTGTRSGIRPAQRVCQLKTVRSAIAEPMNKGQENRRPGDPTWG